MKGKSKRDFSPPEMPPVPSPVNPPLDTPAAWNKLQTDLNDDKTIADIQKNPEKYDVCWQESQPMQMASGDGGVPNMRFRGEPFFGQDRFDHLFWRLRQNGLTIVSRP